MAKLNNLKITVFSVIAIFVVLGVIIIKVHSNNKIDLPFDQTNPVIYDNDGVGDVYTDEYLMALASAGDIKLVGMISTTSIAPFNEFVPPEMFDQNIIERDECVESARSSGFRFVPDPVAGVKGHLEKPLSGNINDTQPIGSEGTSLIVKEAKKATTDKPLVVVIGGPLTSLADAYLTDNSIAEKIIVSWLGGTPTSMADYNGWADPWAAYIVLNKFRLIIFPAYQIGIKSSPIVGQDNFAELPDNKLRQWMIKKKLPKPLVGIDADAPPAIALMRKEYITDIKRVKFSHWIPKTIGKNEYQLPAFQEDKNGAAVLVTKVNRKIATHEWWRALKNPNAYHKSK